MFSGGTRSGTSFSGACAGEHPAATDVAPRIRRKNRLPIPGSLNASSLVAGGAVDAGLAQPVALHAEAHVHVVDLGVLFHVRDVAVALGALEPPREVPLVAEPDVVGLAEDAPELERPLRLGLRAKGRD